MEATLIQRTAVVTGGNAGIGLETVKRLLQSKVRVIFGSRDEARNKAVIEDLGREGQHNVSCFRLDLTDAASIRAFAKEVGKEVQSLDLLINNAGVMALDNRRLTETGVEMQFATNHLGHFLLTHELFPLLKKSKEARIINLSSVAHFSANRLDVANLKEAPEYSPWGRYQETKLCNVLFSVKLAALCKTSCPNVTVYSLHPGVIDTQLFANNFWGSVFRNICCCCMKTAREGSNCSVFLATTELAKLQSGEYYDSDCSWRQMNPLGRETRLQDELWKESERLLQISFSP